MSNWHIFQQYAKDHPEEVPRDIKARSKFYKRLMDTCKCGEGNKLCQALFSLPQKQRKTSFSLKHDTLMLHAENEALKEVLNEKERYIEELEKLCAKKRGNKAYNSV